MSTKKESWTRLELATWCNNPILAKMNDKSAKFMKLNQGVGPVKKDEYAILVDSFPGSLTPMDFLREFAADPNKTVNNTDFDSNNVFKKRLPKQLKLGDIWDINIWGPDNGSIVLAKMSKTLISGHKTKDAWIDIHTIECDKYGTHPECGAREFGYENSEGKVRFYTRGVSRAYMQIHRAGNSAQDKTWRAMLKGLAAELLKRGASISDSSVKVKKS